ncbi:MAG TPA: hypothetical protein VH208_07725, partial [Myxococcaceae bacterium]|nr:hypothetical protein [Myxococcaceae bacterium]
GSAEREPALGPAGRRGGRVQAGGSPCGGRATSLESGANRVAFVRDGDGPINLELSWNAG